MAYTPNVQGNGSQSASATRMRPAMIDTLSSASECARNEICPSDTVNRTSQPFAVTTWSLGPTPPPLL